jgi:hypothetical protein
MAEGSYYSPQISIGRAKQYVSPYSGFATAAINWSDLINSTSVGRFASLEIRAEAKFVPYRTSTIKPVSLPRDIIAQQDEALMLAEEMDIDYDDPIDQLARLLEEIEGDGKAWREIIDDQYD